MIERNTFTAHMIADEESRFALLLTLIKTMGAFKNVIRFMLFAPSGKEDDRNGILIGAPQISIDLTAKILNSILGKCCERRGQVRDRQSESFISIYEDGEPKKQTDIDQ